MKWLIVIAVTLVVYAWALKIKSNVKLFMDNYEIFLVDKEDVERE